MVDEVDSADSRLWSIAVGTICLALLGFIALVLHSWLVRTPTVEAAVELARPHELIAFSSQERRPHMLMIDGDRLVFDRMQLDWHGLSEPNWRFTTNQYRIERTATPASAALLTCAGDAVADCDRSIDLIGELRDGGITHVEIAIDGQWERHLVFGQGFIVPIDRRRTIGDLRWLDADGDVVWAIDRDLDGRIAAHEPGPVSIRDVARLQAR